MCAAAMPIQLQQLCIMQALWNYFSDFCEPPVGKYTSLEATKQTCIIYSLSIQNLKNESYHHRRLLVWLRLTPSALCMHGYLV